MSTEHQEQHTSEQPEAADQAGIVASDPPYYTIIIIVAFAVVFLVQLQSGFEASIDLASFDKPLFQNNGEYWRILTGAALHGGVLHLLFNAYAMYSFGRIMELLTDRSHVAIVFLMSAVSGGLLSLAMSPDGRSVGASGGIVGVIGYLLVYSFRRRQFISPEFRNSLVINIGFIMLYGFLLHQIIDNYGHIGGLIFGASYAFAQVPADPNIDPRATNQIMDFFGIGMLAIYVAVCGITIMKITGIA